MEEDSDLLQCYNRGCGQKYDPSKNADESCRHHPGAPFFHDAYKGWSCCNKKCTDFTEFLNIKGCTLSKHSNIKPPEPEKSVQNEVSNDEVIEVKPIIAPSLKRPPLDSPLTYMTPTIAPSLKQQLETKKGKDVTAIEVLSTGEIPVGTNCKNGGCTTTYEGPSTDDTTCVHHPGVPIFHEGMKYWSCCQRKTSDFNSFLNQEGCERGKHKWIKEEDKDPKSVKCRWDWHQTGSHVVVTVYAKEYCPEKSFVKLNPIKLVVCLVFPLQNNGTFNLDMELKGIVNVEESKVSMYGTKVEISLKKAEPGAWSKLEIPKIVPEKGGQGDLKMEEVITSRVEEVDLDDL